MALRRVATLDIGELRTRQRSYSEGFDPRRNRDSGQPSSSAIKDADGDDVGLVFAETVTAEVITHEVPQMLSKEQWVADTARASCHCCGQRFTRTLRRHHCRFCGEVVCLRCSAHRVQNARICILCYHSSKAQKISAAAIATEKSAPKMEGILQKWTSQLYGWQSRFIVLERMAISEYMGAKDNRGICRESIDLRDVIVRTSRTQPRRFEVVNSVTGASMLLRAYDARARNAWVNAVLRSRSAATAAGDAAGSFHKRRNHSRNPSLSSMDSIRSAELEKCTLELGKDASNARPKETSVAEGKRMPNPDHDAISEANLSAVREQQSNETQQIFRQRMSDGEDFLALVKEQTRRLIEYWTVVDSGEDPVTCTAVRRDALLFKSTIAGATGAFRELLDAFSRLETEQASRIQELTLALQAAEARAPMHSEAGVSTLAKQTEAPSGNTTGSSADASSVLEGPECELDDDDFFDAVESGLDSLEKAEAAHESQLVRQVRSVSIGERASTEDQAKYALLVNKKVADALDLLQNDDVTPWSVVHRTDGMVVSRAECADSDDTTVNRTRVVATFKKATAREVCELFHSPEGKVMFDSTIADIRILAEIDASTRIVHILHKRVWPTAPRDSCTISHTRRLDDGRWIVFSESVDHPDAPVDKFVRSEVFVFLIAKTTGATRADLVTEVTYIATVDPGGWAPKSVVEAVSKREFPKILNKLAHCAEKHYAGKPVSM